MPISEIDANGLIVLDARAFDVQVGGSYNDIRVEAEFVEIGR